MALRRAHTCLRGDQALLANCTQQVCRPYSTLCHFAGIVREKVILKTVLHTVWAVILGSVPAPACPLSFKGIRSKMLCARSCLQIEATPGMRCYKAASLNKRMRQRAKMASLSKTTFKQGFFAQVRRCLTRGGRGNRCTLDPTYWFSLLCKARRANANLADRSCKLPRVEIFGEKICCLLICGQYSKYRSSSQKASNS